MQRTSRRMNQQILAGIADADLATAARRLNAVKRNLLEYLRHDDG